MSIRCFWLEPVAGKFQHELRRYHSSSDENDKCPLLFGYHNASVVLGVVEREADQASRDTTIGAIRLDPRWPQICGCGYVFSSEDRWQENFHHLFKRSDTGELVTLNDAPVGAMWDAEWLRDWHKGPDGRCLIVRVPKNPDGTGQTDWMVDGRASNCTRREDNVHKCWVRHGEPPNIHVDKFGDTCAAGAGSILSSGGWHGFLHNGYLVTC